MSESRYAHTLFTCVKPRCNFVCYTVNQLQEHMLDKHSTVFVPRYTVNGLCTQGDANESPREP
jgi:hypothetical protein